MRNAPAFVPSFASDQTSVLGVAELLEDFRQKLPMPTVESGGVCYDLWKNSLDAEELGAIDGNDRSNTPRSLRDNESPSFVRTATDLISAAKATAASAAASAACAASSAAASAAHARSQGL